MTVTDDDFAVIRRRLEQDPPASIPAQRIAGLAAFTNGTLDYAEATSGVTLTHTTDATADTLVTGGTLTLDGVTAILVEFFAPNWTNAAGAARSITVVLYAAFNGGAAAVVGRLCRAASDGAANPQTIGTGRYRYTPAAGSYVYSARGFVNSATGTVTINAGAAGSATDVPMFLRVTRDTLTT